MKTDHNLVWSEIHADKSITIGFTKKCIDELLQECFHVLQADSTSVREKGPMLVLETNDGLESIKSPFAGKIAYFNPKARNYPDKLTTEDTVLTIHPPGMEKKSEAVKVKPVKTEMFNQIDWATMVVPGGVIAPIINQQPMIAPNARAAAPELHRARAVEELQRRQRARQRRPIG